jgi:hypothetical protein
MSNRNRKATKAEMAHARRVIQEAYPEWTPVFSGRGKGIAPRIRTISFRLRDDMGKFHTNVVWLMPDELAKLTSDEVRAKVAAAGGNN